MAGKKPLVLTNGSIKEIGAGDTVPISNGGTGATTATAALNALLPSQTGNNTKVLGTDGTNTSWVAVSGGTISLGDKGDITVSGTGDTWTIDASVVTYSKIQNAFGVSLKGL